MRRVTRSARDRPSAVRKPIDLPSAGPITDSARREQFFAALRWLALCVFVCVLLRTGWLSDDAYITFRVIDNFVQGNGLRWNVADRVQVFTHPLWMMLIAAVHFLTREIYYTALSITVVVSTLAVYLVGFRNAANVTLGILGLSILFSSRAFIDYSTSGLENPLTHLLLVLFVMRSYRAPDGHRGVLELSLLAGLGMLNRLDTALLFLPLLMWSVIESWNRRTLTAAAVGMAPLVGWLGFATVYYGYPLPNTAVAKLGVGIGAVELTARGLHYFWNSLHSDPITLTTIAAAAIITLVRRDRQGLLLILGILLYLVYILRIGGDFMSGRFFATPLFLAVCVMTRSRLFRRRGPTLGLAALAVALGLIAPYPVLASGADYGLYRRDVVDARGVADERGFYFWSSGLFNGRDGSKPVGIVVSRARNARRCGYPLIVEGGVGFLGFVAGPDVHVVDYHGLGDAVLARLPMVTTDLLYREFIQNQTGRQPRDRYRIGHYLRVVPPGYLSHLLGGEDRFVDPRLRRLVERLDRITRGPLFDRDRLKEILPLIAGRLDGTREDSSYRRLTPTPWDEVIAAVPDSPAGYAGLGISLFGSGRLEPAERALRNALNRCPDDTEAAHSLAIIRWRSGDPLEARALLQHAASIDPDFAYVQYGLAHVHAGAGETDRAVETFARAALLDPGLSSAARSATAEAYLDAGRHEEAAAALADYLRLRPLDADAHLRLGDTLLLLDHRDAAVAAWRSAAELGSGPAADRLGREK